MYDIKKERLKKQNTQVSLLAKPSLNANVVEIIIGIMIT